MAIKKIEMRPEGTNDYGDILYPKTSADMVEETSTHKIMTSAERVHIAKVPNIETTLVEHLAENMSHWHLIDNITLDVDTAQLVINVPDTYNEFRIIGHNLQQTGASAVGLKVRLNNDPTSMYTTMTINGTNVISAIKDNFTIEKVLTSSATYCGELDLSIINNGIDSTLLKSFSSSSGTTDGASVSTGLWRKKEKINIISLIPSTSLLKSGSVFEVWGR